MSTTTATSEGFLLSHVVNQGDVAAAQALLSEMGISPNEVNASGETALHVAIRRCLPAMAELLLRFGANAAQPSDVRCGAQTPLHLAAELDQCTILTMLLAFGADPSVRNAQRQTPLHVAALLGHVAAARVLVAHGADVSASDSLGRTPLSLAETAAKRSASHAEIAAALLAAIRDAYGASAAEAHGVDEAAVALAGGPIAVLGSGQSVKVSGVPILASTHFVAEARSEDATRIAWLQTAPPPKTKPR